MTEGSSPKKPVSRTVVMDGAGAPPRSAPATRIGLGAPDVLEPEVSSGEPQFTIPEPPAKSPVAKTEPGDPPVFDYPPAPPVGAALAESPAPGQRSAQLPARSSRPPRWGLVATVSVLVLAAVGLVAALRALLVARENETVAPMPLSVERPAAAVEILPDTSAQAVPIGSEQASPPDSALSTTTAPLRSRVSSPPANRSSRSTPPAPSSAGAGSPTRQPAPAPRASGPDPEGGMSI